MKCSIQEMKREILKRMHHIVQKACIIDTLLDETIAFANAINKRRPVVAEMKKRLNHAVVHAIDVEDVAYIESAQFNIG